MIRTTSVSFIDLRSPFNVLLLSGVLAGSLFVSPISAQTAAPAPQRVTAGAPTRYQPNRVAKRAGEYYGLIWGVDSLSVKAVESGELIRFAYRVLDPDKAKLLNDKDTEAYLNAPEHHLQLVVPSLEKVGKLRQSNKPEPGRSYWMAFSNPRRTVKPGDRVNVVIGQFHADGLVVE
jgi:hypothetical protein